MQYQFPHTIQNKHGEKLTFLRMEGERVICENFVQPNAGPPMHVVKKVIMPVTYFLGRLLGKYEKFKNAPQPR